MDLKQTIAGRISAKIISEICTNADRNELFSLIDDTDDRTAYNALWCMTHWGADGITWLESHRDALIDRAIGEIHKGKLRLMLTLLERMTWTEDDIRSDFLDFCLAKINTPASYGIRSLAAKLAYTQCRFFPEMVSELLDELELMTIGELSPALRTTRKNILKKIDRSENKHAHRT